MVKFIITAVLVSAPFILNACSSPADPEPQSQYEECIEKGSSEAICHSKYGEDK